MKHIVVKACFALMFFGLLSLSGPAAVAASAAMMPDTRNDRTDTGDGTEADSLRKQRLIDEQLDFISENTISLLDEGLDLPFLPELTPLTIEGRLKKLEDQVPLTYNEQVQQFIERYSTDRYRSHLSRMMGLGQYYFELYDRVFEETGLPKEIKYLSVVESALDPHAVSRVGATGPWQFMFATARMYGLQMDSDIDERKDPVAASYAASRYLLEAYSQFGDWLLAIAAYNCGPGNVTRAIRRSGLEHPDFWSISRYLPRETRNYVPAFIAMTYMLEYHEEYGVQPSVTELAVPTEMVNVQQHVAFSSIAKALDTDEALIRALNPAYKRDRIKGSFDSPRRLILPVVDPLHYADLYLVLNEPPPSDAAAMLVNAADDHAGHPAKQEEPVSHRVTPGESLARIAKRYDVTVQDLKAWNNLRSDRIVPGQQLAVLTPSKAAAAKQEPQIYIVKKGDSLSTIAARHKGVTVSRIKAANGLKSDRINPGMKLKIM